jgi:hypothetical protein
MTNEYKNIETGEIAPAHRIGRDDFGAKIYQFVEGWEPTFPYESDEDGNWIEIDPIAQSEKIASEVQDSVSAEEWSAIRSFNQYCSNKLGLTLVFYRTESGKAAYDFRPRTSEETAEYHDGLVEDLA